MALSFNVLRLRDFRLLLSARICMVVALQAQAIIVGWQIYSITKDPFMLGLTGLTEALPAILCALFSGHIVDISRPHRVFLLCVGALILNTLMLFLVGGGHLDLSDKSVVALIFVGVFISGVARSFIAPSSFSLFAKIIPRADFAAGTAWMSSGFQLGNIIGPAMAGLIYGGYGAKVAWVLPLSLTIMGFLLVASMEYVNRQHRNSSTREPAIQSIKAGWHFILTNQVILWVMALDMFAVLFGGAVAMLPAYADKVLHVGSEGLGILRAAPAIGAIATALFLALRPMQKIRGSVLLAVIAGFGFCIIGFGLSTIFWLSVGFLILSGLFDSISVVIRSTILQLLTPENMRGRVSSVNSMFIVSSNELGAFESGVAAKLFGLVPSVIFGGMCTLGIVAVATFSSKRLRETVIEAKK